MKILPKVDIFFIRQLENNLAETKNVSIIASLFETVMKVSLLCGFYTMAKGLHKKKII